MTYSSWLCFLPLHFVHSLTLTCVFVASAPTLSSLLFRWDAKVSQLITVLGLSLGHVDPLKRLCLELSDWWHQKNSMNLASYLWVVHLQPWGVQSKPGWYLGILWPLLDRLDKKWKDGSLPPNSIMPCSMCSGFPYNPVSQESQISFIWRQ